MCNNMLRQTAELRNATAILSDWQMTHFLFCIIIQMLISLKSDLQPMRTIANRLLSLTSITLLLSVALLSFK